MIRKLQFLAIMFLTAMLGYAQQAQEQFINVPIDMTVVINEHPTTADMVELTLLNANYPEELLRGQIQKLGELTGTSPRGVVVYRQQIDPQNKDIVFLKAKFAINGLIERSQQELRLEPILKAFAGSPDPYTLKGITVLFDREKPNKNTVRSISNKGIRAQGRVLTQPPGIEYGVEYLSQDPALIQFPSRYIEQTAPVSASRSGSDIPIYAWIAIGVAGVSIGALVYLALLKKR